jgi:predicted KAP-like P-loop ATPase
LYGEHARPEQEWFVTREQLLELDRILVGKIRQASQDGSLLNTPRLLLVLNFWCEKGGQDEARAWVAGTVTDDRKLAEFLERCLHGSSSFSFGDAVGRKHDRLDPNWLKAYLDADEIVSRVRNLSQSVSISDRQRRAVNQFLKEYDFRKRGGNPDDPFAQDHIA